MTKLKKIFPHLPNRAELLETIHNSDTLSSTFNSWEPLIQEDFLDACTGAKGPRVLYDAFFKEVMNPEYTPERLESFLSILLQRKVKIVRILPNDSTRIADEASLLITDVIVELDDGSLANVEIQKIGYTFPGERSACYSADMLLRQYKRVRSAEQKKFSYKHIKNVYLIIFYENSPKAFKAFPHEYYHRSKQVFNTGLQLNLLQEFIMIPLDIYHEKMDNKPIETHLDAWLTFLSSTEPDKIIELITKYPEFKAMYDTLYQTYQNIERVMNMFSEELRILDKNTVLYMVEEQQQELDKLNAQYEQVVALHEQAVAQHEQAVAQHEQDVAQHEQDTAELERLKTLLDQNNIPY